MVLDGKDLPILGKDLSVKSKLTIKQNIGFHQVDYVWRLGSLFIIQHWGFSIIFDGRLDDSIHLHEWLNFMVFHVGKYTIVPWILWILK